jgi:hypothetical protein
MTLVQGQNTLQLKEGEDSPNANLEIISFVEGHWKGQAFGGDTEEIWSPPSGNSMMFVFRHLVDGEVTFYEIGHIRAIENTLIFELRHFDTDLHAWEEKNEVQQFKFIKAEDNRVYFNGFTFEKVSTDEINIYGLIGNEDGSSNEVVFNYKRT